ncbi:MAG: glycosyl hydrolase [Saprospiraceae bacterium]|nr:glycosyl hydrolase [Saprospiraceae bacterium]
MMKSILTVTYILLFVPNFFAQVTSASERQSGYEHRLDLREQSLIDRIPFENIGPTVFSGRVVDIEVSPSDPTIFYVAYASGGLWKTINNGTTFTPLFDDEAVMTIGDIAVDWSTNTIWIGTGESNASRSSYAGNGIYKSEDDGVNWIHLGLAESHHIGRLLVNPEDPNTVLVAACGHLYSKNEERGVYRTTDGGSSWSQVLYINDQTSAIDLLYDPLDPSTVYAAMWQRERKAWDFIESGAGSGIYKSQDGGLTWQPLQNDAFEFPTGEGVGRIGLAASVSNGQTHLFALLDNYHRRPDKDEKVEGLTKDELRDLPKQDFLKLSDEEIKGFLERYRFPREYGLKEVRHLVSSDQILPRALVEYVEDANSLLFDTPVIGAEVYHTADGGISWRKTHEDYLEYVYNSYGYYFGQIRAHPSNPEKLFILGVPFLRSDDGGSSWLRADGPSVHSDHHALWINPDRPGHIINGNDGGINISYDDGDSWTKQNSPAVGQFYAIAIDKAKPYHVYGGTQDNGVWKGPRTYTASNRWHSSGDYPYDRVLGGDGMQVQVDWRDNNTIYTGFQFGNYFRIDQASGQRKRISPKHKLGERPLRFNWETPIHLSRHNQDILYLGSNKLHRSMTQGDSWDDISGDLTAGGRKGDVAFGTLTTIDESPIQFGLLYTGSDDGQVQVSPDGGISWKNISADLPENLWIAQVVASEHHVDRVYAALNGYRNDDFAAYLFRSDDRGQQWHAIHQQLPAEPINTICEDPSSPEILYVGTDHGLYVTLDGGLRFHTMDHNLPNVAVHDILVHPDEKELVVGTHGRSIFIADIGPLQELTPTAIASDLYLFDIDDLVHSNRWGGKRLYAKDPFYKPTLNVVLYSNRVQEVNWLFESMEGLVLSEGKFAINAGLNYLSLTPEITENADVFRRALAKKQEDYEWNEPDNGVMYPEIGEYKIRVGSVEKTVTVKKR